MLGEILSISRKMNLNSIAVKFSKEMENFQ